MSPEDMYDYKLSAQQRAELAQINNALDDARRSGRFSEQELGELERQATAKRLGIKPLPTPRTEPPVPVFHTEEQGKRWIMNGQKWDPVDKPEKPKDDFAALLKLTPETRTEMQRNPATGKDEPVEVPLTMDERLAEMEKLRQMRDRFNSGGSAPGAEESAPDPLTQTFMQYMGLGGMGSAPAPGSASPAPEAPPAAPPAAAPADDLRKKWANYAD